MSHHANDGSASRARRALGQQAGPQPDPAAAMAALYAQQARCARGEHAVVEAKDGYVTYVRGERLAPGTRWCCCCHVILTDQEPAPATAATGEADA